MSRRKSSLLRQWKCREGSVHFCGSGNVKKEEFTVAAVEMMRRKSSNEKEEFKIPVIMVPNR